MWRRTLAVGALALTTACGVDLGADKVCTAIGALTGVTFDIDLATAVTGEVEVCWDGRCATPELTLHPSSSSAPGTCSGTAPTDVCSASSVPTGGVSGFVTITELPTAPVTVSLRLADQSGTTVLDDQVTVTPETVYPNGPDCGAGGPQAAVHVRSDGSIAQK